MIYTSTSNASVSLTDKVNVASYSVSNCNELGLTGRVLVVPEMAINILEGPKAILSAYVDAIRNDSLIELLVIHRERSIEAREFSDYAVWMTYKGEVQMRGVYRLTAENFQEALPTNLSVKTRLFIEANFTVNGVAA